VDAGTHTEVDDVRAQRWTLYARRSVQCDRQTTDRAKDQVRSATGGIGECIQAIDDEKRREEKKEVGFETSAVEE
jgi:hypothetical protein